MLHRQPVDELIAKNKSALYTLDMNLSGFSLESKAFDHPPIIPGSNAREYTHSFCARCVHACLCVRACGCVCLTLCARMRARVCACARARVSA